MTPNDTTQTPTPQVDEGTPVKAKSAKRKTVAKKQAPRTLAAMTRQIKKDEAKAIKAARPKATHNYKIPVEPDVAKTLSDLSAMSGYSIRYLHRLALANLISVYAPYYGLENWAAPEVRLPPPPLPTSLPPAPAPAWGNPQVADRGGYMAPDQQALPTPMWPNPVMPTTAFPNFNAPSQQPMWQEPPSRITMGMQPPLQQPSPLQPNLTPYQSEYGEIDGIPSETVPFRL